MANIALLFVLIPGAVALCFSDTNPTDDQIATIRSGKAVAKNPALPDCDEI
jgi:hypothetical protein